MNKVILIGNLTKDPELATTSSGISVCKFSVAVNRPFLNANNERVADFFNIVTWRGLAESCSKYLTKGAKVSICGSLQTRTYDDRDGHKRTLTEIQAEDVEFLCAKKEEIKPQKQPVQTKITELKAIENDDEFPF